MFSSENHVHLLYLKIRSQIFYKIKLKKKTVLVFFAMDFFPFVSPKKKLKLKLGLSK
jgi:hypothetical protein